MNRVRCAIYTRKSSDEGLDQAFNSLHAQREACEAYITSQKHEGWAALPAHYDDGGASGGNLDRIALQQLLADIDAGRIDMVVVYKIDRLTRSLADFAKLVERLEKAGASFVSVTQQFNTSTSMGRLTLNVLLSFAQFEREVTAERIRDKIAASKKKGMWMGGLVPLGYDKVEAGLVINTAEAETVRALFNAYIALGNVRRLQAFADQHRMKTKTRITKTGVTVEGQPFSRGRLYHLLSNPIYIGRIRHREQVFDGLHDAILKKDLWDEVQSRLKANAVIRSSRSNARSASLLAGKVFDANGRSLTPSHASKGGKRYRYYVSKGSETTDRPAEPEWRIPASELELAVMDAVATHRELLLERERAGKGALSKTELAAAIVRVQIKDGLLQITLEAGGASEPRCISVPFTLRRRGVETRLVLNGASGRAPDTVLIRRILRATGWAGKIKAGQSFVAIAEGESITPEYISQNIGLAFLSPKILTAISEGRQRPDVSAYQLSKVKIPASWPDQDRLFL
jgi:site-specific DNA recombinase